MPRTNSPLATATWAGRTLRGLSWGLLYSAAYTVLNWFAWQAGCRTSRMTGLELERSDIVGAVLIFAIGVTTAATVVALTKPFCRSWPALQRGVIWCVTASGIRLGSDHWTGISYRWIAGRPDPRHSHRHRGRTLCGMGSMATRQTGPGMALAVWSIAYLA